MAAQQVFLKSERKYIFPSAGKPLNQSEPPQKKHRSCPLKAMRKTFTQPQFLPGRRFYTFCPYFNPSYISLTPLFTNRFASTSTAKQPLSKTPPGNQPSPIADPNAPHDPYATFADEHTPRPLSRPLGQLQPPQPGENTGVDPRSWRERRDDFFNYDKHTARRKQLTAIISKPYFRDWTTLQYHSGKAFLSPRTLFRASKARFFPNLRGYTLANQGTADCDTTPALRGKVSVVTVFSGLWAHRQTETFSPGGMDTDAERKREGWQRVEVNIEEKWFRALILKASRGSLRKTIAEEAWGRYFIVNKGLNPGGRWQAPTDFPGGVREALGIRNTVVGYVYLVDWECRIRWAGSGNATEGEAEALARGVKRLVEEMLNEKSESKIEREEQEKEKGKNSG